MENDIIIFDLSKYTYEQAVSVMPRNPTWVDMCDRYFKDVLENRKKEIQLYDKLFTERKLDLIRKNNKIMYHIRRIFQDYRHGNKSRNEYEIETKYLIMNEGYSEEDAFIFIKYCDLVL